MRFTCVLAVVFGVFEASALSTEYGFDGFNLNGGCESNLPATDIQAPILDASQIRLLDFLTQQTGDFVKSAVKPQIRKEFFSISPIKRFSQASSLLTQTIPFSSGRNLELSAFPFSPFNSVTSRIFNEVNPVPTEKTKSGILSRNRAGSVNIGRTIGGGSGGSYPEVLNESFLGNSNGAVTDMGSSFPGSGGFLEDSLLAGPSALGQGIINAFSNQGY